MQHVDPEIFDGTVAGREVVCILPIRTCALVVLTIRLNCKFIHVHTVGNIESRLLRTLRRSSSTTEYVSKGVVTLLDWVWRYTFSWSFHDLDGWRTCSPSALTRQPTRGYRAGRLIVNNRYGCRARLTRTVIGASWSDNVALLAIQVAYDTAVRFAVFADEDYIHHTTRETPAVEDLSFDLFLRQSGRVAT